MLRKLGLIILGLFLTAVFLNLWMIPLTFIVQFVFGLDSEMIFNIEYAIATIAGVVCAVFCIRPLWK